MGRTPLLRALRTLFVEHRAARQLGVPVEALRERRARAAEERARRGVTRRQFLAGAGAAAALVARPPAARAAAGPAIAIVGGGIAGLTCALELADRGIAATVYEASGRVGGRMFSNTGGYWDAGQVTEWCGELIDTGHRTIRRLARRFDLTLDDLLGAQPTGSDDIYRFFGALLSEEPGRRGLLGHLRRHRPRRGRGAGFPTHLRFASPRPAQPSISMSVYDYIERRVPGGHRSPLGALLDIAYAIEYGADIDRAVGAQPALPARLPARPTRRSRSSASPTRSSTSAAATSSCPRPSPRPRRRTRSRPASAWRGSRRPPTGRYRLTFERGQRHERGRRRLRGAGAAVRGARRGRLSSGAASTPSSCRPSPSRAAATTASCSCSSPGATGSAPGRGRACPTARATRTPATRRRWEATRAQTGEPGHPGLLLGRLGDRRHAHRPAPSPRPRTASVRHDAGHRAGPDRARVSRASTWNGKATQSLPHKSPLFRASYSFYKRRPVHDVRRLRGGARRAACCSAASTRRSTSRASWRAAPRGPARGQAAGGSHLGVDRTARLGGAGLAEDRHR